MGGPAVTPSTGEGMLDVGGLPLGGVRELGPLTPDGVAEARENAVDPTGRQADVVDPSRLHPVPGTRMANKKGRGGADMPPLVTSAP